MLGATQAVALPSVLCQFRQSAREWVGAAVRFIELEPNCTPICPPGELGTLAVDGAEVECIWAALRKEKESTAKARRRVFFAFMGLPLGSNRGRADRFTLTRKTAKSNENFGARASFHSSAGQDTNRSDHVDFQRRVQTHAPPSVPFLPVRTPELLPKYQVEPRLSGRRHIPVRRR
jgi:hypothetical protein